MKKLGGGEFQKAKWKIGDEKVYQGITYYVHDLNSKGQPKWRKKKDGGSGASTTGGSKEKIPSSYSKKKRSKKDDLDFDTKTLLTHYVNRQNFPLVHVKMGQELDGHKIGEKNDKNEFWMPKREHHGREHHSGHWVSKQELENFENNVMMGILKDKHYKSMPIGKEFKDNKGNSWKVVKHLPDYDGGYDGGGRIRLKMTNKNGKSKTYGVNVSVINAIKRHKGLTTGISSLDEYIRENF